MARPRTLDDSDLIAKLSMVFRDEGFEGASLSDLAQAAGLKRASLYHRFPGGKEQMAQEVLANALEWFGANVVGKLQGDGTPQDRLNAALTTLAEFYANGKLACLLNMLSAPDGTLRATDAGIRAGFTALTDGFGTIAEDAGMAPELARKRAVRAVALLHGSLVMSRGLGETYPFTECLEGIRETLLGRATEADQ